jgi:hypothetical protein
MFQADICNRQRHHAIVAVIMLTVAPIIIAAALH